eukprot:5498103-Ditylum_brightwellii.AAC.1
MVRLKTWLIELILDYWSGGSPVKWRMVYNITKSIEVHGISKLTTTELHAALINAKYKFYQLKKECWPLQSALYGDKIKTLNLKGKVGKAKKNTQHDSQQEGKRSSSKTQKNECTREQGWILRLIPLMKPVSLSAILRLEEACMKEVVSRSQISKASPPM